MTPTDELRTALRSMIAEAIPAGGSAADTRFSDAEIDALLAASYSIHEAASAGWMAKAGKAADERGGLVEMAVGTERMRWMTPSEFREHCQAMAELYSDLAGEGSRLFAMAEPDVLGIAGYGRSGGITRP